MKNPTSAVAKPLDQVLIRQKRASALNKKDISLISCEPMELREGEAATFNGRPFDMEERTCQFGEEIISFCKSIPRNPVNDTLISQLGAAGTSVGANFHEANDSVSKKDFRFTIKRCLKEAKEARFFLRMAAKSEPQLAGQARVLYREATELLRILFTMWKK